MVWLWNGPHRSCVWPFDGGLWNFRRWDQVGGRRSLWGITWGCLVSGPFLSCSLLVTHHTETFPASCITFMMVVAKGKKKTDSSKSYHKQKKSLFLRLFVNFKTASRKLTITALQAWLINLCPPPHPIVQSLCLLQWPKTQWEGR